MSASLSKSYEEIELFRIKDSSVSEGFLSSRGEVEIISVDATAPILKLKIRDARAFREKLRELVNQQKEEKGVQYREQVS